MGKRLQIANTTCGHAIGLWASFYETEGRANSITYASCVAVRMAQQNDGEKG